MADILIRGMEMPDGCHHCRFSYLDEGETNDGEPCTVLMCSAMNQGTNGAEYDGNRPSWCPLVPLPEGHGRLGDLDRLFEVLGQDADRWMVDEVSMIETDDVLYAIHNAPTIVPAEGWADDGNS